MDRNEILTRLAEGKLTVEEATKLLAALEIKAVASEKTDGEDDGVKITIEEEDSEVEDDDDDNDEEDDSDDGDGDKHVKINFGRGFNFDFSNSFDSDKFKKQWERAAKQWSRTAHGKTVSINLGGRHGIHVESDSQEEPSGFDSIVQLAPFASAKSLAKLVDKEIEKGAEINWKKVIQLAPFLDDDSLSKLAVLAMGNGKPNVKVLQGIAPFLGSKALADLVEKSGESLSMSALISLAPFLDEELIDKLINKLDV